jgi:hypothetical protein
MREKLISEYHQMLAVDETLTSEFFAKLKQRMCARRLRYGGRELGVALRPHVLNSSQYSRLARSSEILAGALNKIVAALLGDPSRMKSVGLTDREISLSLIDPKYSWPAMTTRFDAFVHGDEVKFVEYNAENPSSLPDQAALNELLLEVGAMRTTAQRYKLREFLPVKALLHALTDTFHEWGGTGAPQVAILDWEGLPTADEFVLLREYFASQGVSALICSPEELEYSEGKLHCGSFVIDVVYKRVVIHELLERCDDSHPLIRAYIDGSVCLVNSFRCKMLQKKAVFELLTDEANTSWFSLAEQEVMRHTIPWTRRVIERTTRYQGREVDLIEYIRNNREQLVLKPNDDYGGSGILIGDNVSASEWDKGLSEALAGDYVVQEKIELHTEDFPIFGADEWALQPMYVDSNPFLFRGRVEGAMVRLSDSPVVNVTSGGGETGFFVIDGVAGQ